MKPENIPKDSVGVVISLDEDDTVTVATISNVSQDVPEDIARVLVDAANGISAIVSSGLEMVSTYGATLRALKEEMELNDGEIVFEAEEELEKAISESRVIQFDKNRLN
jgi:hypothetical protein